MSLSKRENWLRGPTVDDFCAGTHGCRPKSRGPTVDKKKICVFSTRVGNCLLNSLRLSINSRGGSSPQIRRKLSNRDSESVTLKINNQQRVNSHVGLRRCMYAGIGWETPLLTHG
jgi:hypothetical protein